MSTGLEVDVGILVRQNLMRKGLGCNVPAYDSPEIWKSCLAYSGNCLKKRVRSA